MEFVALRYEQHEGNYMPEYNTPEYNPERFNTTYEARNGPEIFAFLNRNENHIRMETATYLSRPALEPLSSFLLERFGDWIREDRIKQMIGHMVRQIMEQRGYRIDRSNVPITRDGNMFSRATRYVKASVDE